MIRPFITSVVCLSIAACASSGPEAPESAASQPAPTKPVARADAADSAGESAAAEGQLEVVDVPEVPKTANVVAVAAEDANQLVCRRHKTTGSHRVTRVCYTRAEIEAARAEAQEMLRGLNRKAHGTGVPRDREITQRPMPGGQPDFH